MQTLICGIVDSGRWLRTLSWIFRSFVTLRRRVGNAWFWLSGVCTPDLRPGIIPQRWNKQQNNKFFLLLFQVCLILPVIAVIIQFCGFQFFRQKIGIDVTAICHRSNMISFCFLTWSYLVPASFPAKTSHPMRRAVVEYHLGCTGRNFSRTLDRKGSKCTQKAIQGCNIFLHTKNNKLFFQKQFVVFGRAHCFQCRSRLKILFVFVVLAFLGVVWKS